MPTDLPSSLVMFIRHGSPICIRTLNNRGTAYTPVNFVLYAAHRPCAHASATRPPGGASFIARARKVVAGGLSLCRAGNRSPVLDPLKSLRRHRTRVNTRNLFTTPCATASRTVVSNAASTWLEKLRPYATHVNLSRYPRRLSRGNCRVPRQHPRAVAGTSAFLFA